MSYYNTTNNPCHFVFEKGDGKVRYLNATDIMLNREWIWLEVGVSFVSTLTGEIQLVADDIVAAKHNPKGY